MWRDHRVKSARRREKGVRPISAWMNEKRSRWSTLMHHCQPRPTVRTRSFNNGVQKGRWEWNHPSFTKVCSSTLLPPKGHLKYLFQKKRKKWGYFTSEMVLCPILWGIYLSHIYAREVRWNFEFDSWYSSKICSCLSKKKWHSLHQLFLIMSTLKGDVRVKNFHFTIIFFQPYVKKGEYPIEFVCGNVIF